ncbi:MAG: DsrE family protein [Acidobacteriota bacterium]
MRRTSSEAGWRVLAAALGVVAALGIAAQAPQTGSTTPRKTGPVIEPYGGTFDVPANFLMPSPDVDYKVKFDVGAPSDDPKAVNRAIDSVARFLNMQVRAGVPRDKMKLALILHTTAAKDVLDHAAYRARFGMDNPNVPLLQALDRAGVPIYVCGQSLAGRGMKFEEVVPAVKVALSAMTMHALLAREGYSTNPF